jgi:hypothetical protein
MSLTTPQVKVEIGMKATRGRQVAPTCPKPPPGTIGMPRPRGVGARGSS